MRKDRTITPAGHRRPRAVTLLFACVVLLAGLAPAKIDLVTLPERGEIELTIYNSEDLTLVRERRTMSFTEGLNELQFSWANTLIDPTSLHLDILEGAEDLDVEYISYPPNTQNTLIWNIRAQEATTGQLEISYFTSGIRWEADFVVKANPAETEASIEGYVRVTNNSGEDYEEAKTRLVVGEINLVEMIAELAQRGVPVERARQVVARRAMMDEARAVPMAAAPMATLAMEEGIDRKEVAKEGVGEYYLFTIEGKEDITDGLSKRLPSFDVAGVPITVMYKQDPHRWGQQVVKFYKFINDEESELGQAPLPNGTYKVFRETDDGALAYEGSHSERYVPIDEEVELNLGSDGLIVLQEKMMRFIRENLSFSSYGDVNGYDVVREMQLIVRNSKRTAVPIEIRRHFSGDFDFRPETAAGEWTKIDQDTFELKASLEPLSESEFDYTHRERTGANASR